jgi:GNAT superfamily N-acetyltransferase
LAEDGPTLSVRFAVEDEIQAIADVLEEAAGWMALRGKSMWDLADIGPAFVAPRVARSEFVVARVAGELAGVCLLMRADPQFWPEDAPGQAGYLHKLAIRRGYAGGRVTSALIEWCAARALGWGCQMLKLDCDHALRPLYERLGFSFVDQRRIEPEGRPGFVVDRFQKRLASPAP